VISVKNTSGISSVGFSRAAGNSVGPAFSTTTSGGFFVNSQINTPAANNTRRTPNDHLIAEPTTSSFWVSSDSAWFG
jgi:hypothetical protein